MVASSTAWTSVLRYGIEEQIKDGGGPVVGVHADASDKARESVYEAVDDELVLDQPCGIAVTLPSARKGNTYHADRHGAKGSLLQQHCICDE